MSESVELSLELSPADDGSYRVEASGVAGAGESIRLPAVELAVRSESIGRALRTADTDALPPELVQDVSAVGQELFDALFVDSVRRAYDSARRAAEDGGVPLRIVLSLSHAPELLSVPWEALYHDPLFLAAQRGTTVVRQLPSQEPLRPALVQGRVRIPE
jgi:hypothetical protein